jgi:hypothetical protein
MIEGVAQAGSLRFELLHFHGKHCERCADGTRQMFRRTALNEHDSGS